MDEWKETRCAWESECKLAKMQAEDDEKKAKKLFSNGDREGAIALLRAAETPVEPPSRRFIVNDATVEKLGELLVENPYGLLSYRDELYGLLTSLDRQGQEGSRSFYLTAYDGNQSYTFDRIGRGTIHAERICLSMVGGIQPGRIQEYIRGAVAGGGADDGLLQRFGLAVWPDIDADFEHVDQWPDSAAKQQAWEVFERLSNLQPDADGQSVVWRFTPEAAGIFVEWLVPFEQELRSDELHPALVSHLSKYRKLVPALALVFALVDTPDSGCLVGANEILRAIGWSEYLRTHADRLYSAATQPETAAATALLEKIKSGKLTDTDGKQLTRFTPRAIAVKHWTGLGSVETVRKAADLLDDYGWLRREGSVVASRGGRPSEWYRIHPCLLNGGIK
jgi:putative DNA primase/helicase